MAETETKSPNQAGPPGTEGDAEQKRTSLKRRNIIATIIVFYILAALLYYFFVWKAIEDAKTRLITTALVAVVSVLLFILLLSSIIKKRDVTGLRVAPKTIILLLIIFGPILSSLLPVILLTPLFKVCIVLFFSLLPGWLYVHFISTKGKTLWDEYVANLFRLHVDHYAHLPEPPEGSIFYRRWTEAQQGRTAVHEDRGIYEKKFLALFGRWPSEFASLAPSDVFSFGSFRAQAEKLGPVVVATLIISVGWVLVVKPGSVGQVFSTPESVGEVSSTMPAPTDLSIPVASTGLSIPFDSICFGFLGAYFYIFQMLVRRYFQNDLKTPAYINATLRIIIVILLVWVVDLLLRDAMTNDASRLVFAFIIGVFPYVGWQAIQALIRLPFQFVVPTLRRKHPLSDLDGLNIWYESRLLEEGIEDMQNLATADLVDVILNTRIPVDRLIDWVDQSLLYMHLGKSKTRAGESDRDKLRRFGIRTATDLDDALGAKDEELVKRLEYLLNAEKQEEPSILRCIQATFKDEPNLYHVREWKGFADRELKPETVSIQQK